MKQGNWHGVITFGLVSIPITLQPMDKKSSDVNFHQIDSRDHARIKYQRVNTRTGKEVPWEKITRGYEYDENNLIPVPDEVLKKVGGAEVHAVDIQTFIKKSDLSILSVLGRNYYLLPDKGGDKGYGILKTILQETNKIGIAKVIISTKEYVAAIMPVDDALLLCLLKYATEIKKSSELSAASFKKIKTNKKELDIAKKLVDSMSSKWRPQKFKDEYQEAIHAWVKETVNKLPHKNKKLRQIKPTATSDFIDLLKKSLASTQKKSKAAVKKHSLSKCKPSSKHVTKH